MTQDDRNKTQNEQAPQDTHSEKKTIDADSADLDIHAEDDADFQMPEGFPGMDENMFGQVQEMMARLERVGELEQENADLKGKLGRLASDFESYRRRTQGEVGDAESVGVAKAAEQLMPVYDDLERAVTMGSGAPASLIPGVQAVQATVLRVFGGLGLEATGREGEHFDPRWHEAIQVVPGDQDDVIVQVYQLGFRMGDRLVRPARVVVSRKG
ncbi:protein grpE [Deinococcus phoenicis]|uniref:Protein GrpE n=1 Tax=Deinococcus phoenicis TaxID=1476583 RepID=A0A016QM95_9DEIO|nr:nucleotide exchange factor GrpE [Deinococcus phoenicis]EYB66997.1 protein grpE [Deinococcus phoenicis]